MITIHHVSEAPVYGAINLYCGRNPSKYPFLIDAQLGNPFAMANEASRDRVCKLYAAWLANDRPGETWKRIERIALRESEGKHVALYCHCAPKRCHCETIRDAALAFLKGERYAAP